MEGAGQHVFSLFFDPTRYDLSRVGRYKYNKKLAVGPRAVGRTLTRPVADPMIGEVLAEAGAVVSREMARLFDSKGVSEAYVKVETESAGEQEFKIMSNGMVDIHGFVDFDPEADGINEHVCFSVLREILDSCEGEEALHEALRARKDELIPKHITIDDIYASISYILGLPYDIGTTDDIDHLGNRRIRSVGELLQNQFRIGFSRMERVVREKMTLQAQDVDAITPQSLINIRPVVAAIKEFFRLFAPVSVYGSDQPAGRADP